MFMHIVSHTLHLIRTRNELRMYAVRHMRVIYLLHKKDVYVCIKIFIWN
jgi:hypothetical protein